MEDGMLLILESIICLTMVAIVEDL